MGDRTSIGWTDASWNCIRGCSRVSAGCQSCYAERVAHRFNAPGLPYEGLTKDGRWNGTVRLVPEHLADPIRWQKPRRIFANSMSDLFHESLPADEIAAIFGVMALAKRHTFQVLTKRPERMRDFLLGKERVSGSSLREMCFYEARNFLGEKAVSGGTPWDAEFPLPNVWLGVSVEDQKTADARIPILLDTPAAVRFVSYEPALGPVDFRAWVPTKAQQADLWTPPGPRSLRDRRLLAAQRAKLPNFLDWIIVGGESGPDARPFDVGWARSTVKQCAAAHVACFVKQLGANAFIRTGEIEAEKMLGKTPAQMEALYGVTPEAWTYDPVRSYLVPRVRTKSKAGSDPSEWTPDLRVQEFPR